MHVDIAPDGLWCFAGVLKGSMELVAVYLGHVEANLNNNNNHNNNNNLLTHVTAYRHSDAKLRGFGACTRLRTHEYLLFTGKGVKNMHIWKFTAPPANQSDNNSPTWTQLYDTTTNGNTISFLQFRHNQNGRLQGITKSQGQKLRVWDLTYEQQQPQEPRPAKPPYTDLVDTTAALGVAGDQCLCGGTDWYHQLALVPLDRHCQLESGWNHTELALPNNGSTANTAVSSRSSRRGNNLQCVTKVATLGFDAGHALLELSDGSVVHYRHDRPMTLFWPAPEHPLTSRCWHIGRVASQGIVLAAVATYHPTTGMGQIKIMSLPDDEPARGFWGFLDLPQEVVAASSSARKRPLQDEENTDTAAVMANRPPPAAVEPKAKKARKKKHGKKKQHPTTTTTPAPTSLVRRPVTESDVKTHQKRSPPTTPMVIVPATTAVTPAAQQQPPSTPQPQSVTRKLTTDFKAATKPSSATTTPAKSTRSQPKADPTLIIRESCVAKQSQIHRALQKLLDDKKKNDHAFWAKRVLQVTLRELEWVAWSPSVASWHEAKAALAESVAEFSTMQVAYGFDDEYDYVYEVARAAFATMPTAAHTN